LVLWTRNRVGNLKDDISKLELKVSYSFPLLKPLCRCLHGVGY